VGTTLKETHQDEKKYYKESWLQDCKRNTQRFSAALVPCRGKAGWMAELVMIFMLGKSLSGSCNRDAILKKIENYQGANRTHFTERSQLSKHV